MDNTPVNTDTGQKARTPYCPRIPVQQKNWKHTQMLSFNDSYPSAIPSSSPPNHQKKERWPEKKKEFGQQMKIRARPPRSTLLNRKQPNRQTQNSQGINLAPHLL